MPKVMGGLRVEVLRRDDQFSNEAVLHERAVYFSGRLDAVNLGDFGLKQPVVDKVEHSREHVRDSRCIGTRREV